MRFWTVLLAAALLLGSSLSAAADDYQGFRVVGRHLYDGAGEKVVLMGVNKMAIWTDIDGSRTFHEIARTGANAIRIVWLARGSAQQLDTVITTAINNGLIPLLDCHDAIGDWSKLSICVDYWVRPDILSVIRRHERYLLINIANEADSGSLTDTDYKAGYELALRRMRAAGIRVPLVIDAPGWGGRIDSLQKNAPYLMQVDPAQNVMFSLHIYWPTSRMGAKVAEIITSEMRESAEMGLPLIIGEFSRYAIRCEGDVPYRTIIEQGHQLEIGWFAWSWGPGDRAPTRPPVLRCGHARRSGQPG
jgi:mannan endo-1,4-beta-mannosidase